MQVLGIVCEAIGAALVVLGLMGMGAFLLLGAAVVILGMPLLLCVKHPFLLDGWLAVAMSWLVLNPWTSITPMGLLGGIRRLVLYLTVPAARYPSNLFGICVALARGVMTLALAAGTWRACRNKKDPR